MRAEDTGAAAPCGKPRYRGLGGGYGLTMVDGSAKREEMRPDPAPPVPFSVHVAPLAEGGTEVAVFGELDAAVAERMREGLDEALRSPGEVVIDLRACSFIDSMGIALLAGTATRLKDEGRHLVLRRVGKRVLRTFEIAGLASGPSITIETA